jgi:mersacidin/lichenicidin family type 2 lantibiotic
MVKLNIIRAWKDIGYRLSLSDQERSQLPDSPAGAIDLSDTELNYVAGANETELPLGDITVNTCVFNSCVVDCGAPTMYCR